jgi:hypothetical protein
MIIILKIFEGLLTFLILLFFQLNLLIRILIRYASLPFTPLLMLLVLISINIILDLMILSWRCSNYFKRHLLSVNLTIFIFIIFIKCIANFIFWRFFEILNLIDSNDNILFKIIIRINNIFISRWISGILFIIWFWMKIGSSVPLFVNISMNILLNFSLIWR